MFELIDTSELLTLLAHFGLNIVFIWFLIHFLYFRRSQRQDFYFSFMLMGLSTFFMVYMLGDVKFKTGFALGLFAIFSIMRFRTEGMPVREMTYLFAVVALSVINALAQSSLVQLVVVNLIVIVAIWLFDGLLVKPTYAKLIQYDRVELIKPSLRSELIKDLTERTGLRIVSVSVGAIDYLKDTVMLKVRYVPTDCDEADDVDKKLKLRRADREEF